MCQQIRISWLHVCNQNPLCLIVPTMSLLLIFIYTSEANSKLANLNNIYDIYTILRLSI